jgi:hypothetical protein
MCFAVVVSLSFFMSPLGVISRHFCCYRCCCYQKAIEVKFTALPKGEARKKFVCVCLKIYDHKYARVCVCVCIAHAFLMCAIKMMKKCLFKTHKNLCE